MAEGSNGSLSKQGYIAVGVVVAVLITLFTLSNLIPFVYKTEFTDFKADILLNFTNLKAEIDKNFTDIKSNMAESSADRRDLRTNMENLKLDVAVTKAAVATLQNRLDSEDSAAGLPLTPSHKSKSYR